MPPYTKSTYALLAIMLLSLGTLRGETKLPCDDNQAKKEGAFRVNNQHALGAWQITDKENNATVFLMGSTHFGKKGDYPLPESLQLAFENSNVLAVESDVTDSIGKYRKRATSSVQTSLKEVWPAYLLCGALLSRVCYAYARSRSNEYDMLANYIVLVIAVVILVVFIAEARYCRKHAEHLREVAAQYLTEEQSKLVDKIVRRLNLSHEEQVFVYMHPLWLLGSLNAIQVEKLVGTLDYSPEYHFAHLAKQQGKSIIELENSEEVKRRLLPIVAMQYMDTLEAIDEASREYEKKAYACKTGDMDALNELLQQCEASIGKKSFSIYIKQRDEGMSTKIKTFLEKGQRAFIVVGGLHCPGILASFKGGRYAIEQLYSS